MSAPDSVYKLVEKFERDKARFTNPQYNETQLRVEFINPLFEALGWNVRDSAHVSHEDRVIIEGKPKRPDYGFRIAGITRFFLETKKPALNLKDDPSPAYQLRRYGWSGNLPVSVLSDFEEFTHLRLSHSAAPFRSRQQSTTPLLPVSRLRGQLGQAIRIVQPGSSSGRRAARLDR